MDRRMTPMMEARASRNEDEQEALAHVADRRRGDWEFMKFLQPSRPRTSSPAHICSTLLRARIGLQDVIVSSGTPGENCQFLHRISSPATLYSWISPLTGTATSPATTGLFAKNDQQQKDATRPAKWLYDRSSGRLDHHARDRLHVPPRRKLATRKGPAAANLWGHGLGLGNTTSPSSRASGRSTIRSRSGAWCSALNAARKKFEWGVRIERC